MLAWLYILRLRSVCLSVCLISELVALSLPTLKTPNQYFGGGKLLISLRDWLRHWVWQMFFANSSHIQHVNLVFALCSS